MRAGTRNIYEELVQSIRNYGFDAAIEAFQEIISSDVDPNTIDFERQADALALLDRVKAKLRNVKTITSYTEEPEADPEPDYCMRCLGDGIILTPEIESITCPVCAGDGKRRVKPRPDAKE